MKRSHLPCLLLATALMGAAPAARGWDELYIWDPSAAMRLAGALRLADGSSLLAGFQRQGVGAIRAFAAGGSDLVLTRQSVAGVVAR